MTVELLKAVDVAERLNVVQSTLVAWRAQRKGPKWIVTDAGQIRYPADELERWISNHQRDEFSTSAPCPRWKKGNH